MAYELLYDYQYDIAAMLVTITLFAIFQMRRSYVTKANTTFMVAIIVDFLAAFFDACSCFTISQETAYPGSVSILWYYITALGYLLCYNMMSVIYFLYIDAKAKLHKNELPARIAAIAFTVFYVFAILSSPWTHLVAYLDESTGTYCHGPLMSILFILPFLVFIWEIAIFTVARKRFNKYQVITSIIMIAGMGLAVLITVYNPKILVGCFIMSVTMFFAYMAYENPAYYTYEDTQCLNRRAFYEHIKKMLWKKEEFSLLAFSITDFEYYRHGMGTHQLEQLASRLADELFIHFGRKAYTLSEDKYVILLEKQESEQEKIRILEELTEEPIELKNREILVNFTYCTLKDLNERFTADEVEAIVEYRLNHPKARMDSKELVDGVLADRFHREQVLHILKRAIAEDEFHVYYQPIYSVETGRFESAEALIRLFDKDLGFINPEELITIAEQNGYIEQIGEIVFRKVCEFMRINHIEDYGIEYIEVNLSPVQCFAENLADTYAAIMKEYGIAPSRINLEITETAQMAQNDRLLLNMQALNNLGVEFSIDDYGSGFAAANYLIDLPVLIVKIDKSILWPAMKEERAMIVLKNTICMLNELGKHIVVEGVETEEMVKVLTECGADCLQGFYFSRPIPETEFLEFLRARNLE